MLELLKFKTQMCLGCKCMSKSFFLNWVEFLWFYIMLLAHLSNVTKFIIAIIFCYVCDLILYRLLKNHKLVEIGTNI